MAMAIPLLMLLRFSPCSRNSPLIFRCPPLRSDRRLPAPRPPFCSLRSITPTAITTRNTAISNKIPRNTRNPLPYHPSWLPANRLTITTRTRTAPSFHWTAMFPTASLSPSPRRSKGLLARFSEDPRHPDQNTPDQAISPPAAEFKSHGTTHRKKNTQQNLNDGCRCRCAENRISLRDRRISPRRNQSALGGAISTAIAPPKRIKKIKRKRSNGIRSAADAVIQYPCDDLQAAFCSAFKSLR